MHLIGVCDAVQNLQELHAAFADGWRVESIEPVQIEVRPDLKDMQFSEGGPKAWFAVVRRAG